MDRVDDEDGVIGRAAHQAPETDGQVQLTVNDLDEVPVPGSMVVAKVVASEGVDLVAEPLGTIGGGCTEEAGR
ncbi:hypothetical protein GCM10020000_21340 [Streptomyces olivoverticillatus]